MNGGVKLTGNCVLYNSIYVDSLSNIVMVLCSLLTTLD